MSVKISLDHPTLALKNKIQEASQHFLNAFGFNYFQYLRCFADGSVSLLTNNTNLMEYFQQVENAPVVFSSYKNEHENAHSYWFLWDEELPEGPVQVAREKFNIRNGLTLVRRSKQYYDMIAVALPSEQANPGSFYLNKLKAIEQFVNEFDADNKDLITIMNKNPIALPEAYRDINYQNICLTKGKITIAGKHGMTYITTQELACLRLLVQGAAHKKIAQLLDISPRTVETYLLRFKQRTGFVSPHEIDRMMSLYSV
ncbi:MAG: helix-turn-helix transcriptional regulator [Gammaproteobacteria bacterium]